ncbi:MAG: T9SS type A sorting domain-containing protein [Brumimicrobium sp.]
MKKLLLFPIALGVTLYSSSQVNVSTTPTNKVAVLEEYTGNYCTYCPDGHKIADQLDASYGSDIVTLKIQTGSFAGQDPIFGGSLETTTGNTIAAPYDSQGYPNGTVNRTSNYSGIGRGDWSDAVADITSQQSPVNLYIESTVDVDNRTLDVSVEYYYTADAADASNYLHIGYYQDNVAAFQYDPGFYPQNFYILSEEIYEFDHAFRDMVNGDFGEEITPTTTGSTSIIDHTISLPAAFGSFDLEAGAIKVFAYVSSSPQGDISTAIKGTPTFTNFPTTNDASIVFTSAQAQENCVGVDESAEPIILISNSGGDALTSFDVDYGVNGGNDSQSWTGNLSNTEKTAVTLNPTNFTYQATNELLIDLMNPNGATDDNVADNDFSVNFNGGSSEDADMIRVDVKTDEYADEESEFNIYDGSGALIFESDLLPSSTTTSYFLTIPAGTDCYSIELLDDYGDSWDVGITDAWLKIYDVTQGANTLLKTVDATDFGDSYTAAIELTSEDSHANLTEENDFSNFRAYPNPASNDFTVDFETQNASDVTISLVNSVGQEVYSNNLGVVSGKKSAKVDVADLESGMYFVKVKTKNEEKVSRISVTR